MAEQKSFDEGLAERGLCPDKLRRARLVYRHVPTDARHRVSEERLIRALASGQAEERQVEESLQELRDTGLVECTGGGFLKRTPQIELKETHLYAPMKSEIENEWATQPGHNYYPAPQRFVRVFANTGGDGHWERPDLTLIGGKTLPFIPGKFLDVITFEVKFWEDALKGLYEALAHRRRATYSYLVFFPPNKSQDKPNKPKGAVPWVAWETDGPEPWDPEKEREDRERLRKIIDEALRSNLGVIFAAQEDDCSTWKELVSPIRHSPDPELLHDFVLTLIDRPTDRKTDRYEERSALRNWLEASSFEDLTDSELDALELRSELRETAKEFYREVPSVSKRDERSTCPGVKTLAKRLHIDLGDAAEIFEALQAAGHVDERSGRGRKGVVRTKP